MSGIYSSMASAVMDVALAVELEYDCVVVDEDGTVSTTYSLFASEVTTEVTLAVDAAEV